VNRDDPGACAGPSKSQVTVRAPNSGAVQGFRLDERVQTGGAQERRTHRDAADRLSRDEHRIRFADPPALTSELLDERSPRSASGPDSS
jgi:hypothetical protein